VSRGERTARDRVIGVFEPQQGRAASTPSSGYRREKIGKLLDKGLLLFRRKHQRALALALIRKRGKDAAAYAKISMAHVRTFHGSRESKGQAAKAISVLQIGMHIPRTL
jgi:hypothetical protein